MCPFTPPDPRDEPVRGGTADEFVHRVALAARRHHQRAVLDEGTGVDEVVHVLTRGALPGAAATLHRLGAQCVAGKGLAFEHFREVGPDRVEVEILPFAGIRRGNLGLVQHEEGAPLGHRVPFADDEPPDPAGPLRRDQVLHLHRFHDEQLAAEVNRVPFRDEHLDHGALHRREDRPRLRCGRNR